MHCTIKDDVGLETTGVYKMYDLVFLDKLAETSLNALKVHKRSLRLLYPNRSAVA